MVRLKPEHGARRMTAHDRLEVPDLILEQYRLNELPPQDVERVERLLREDGTLQHRLEALDRSDAEIARQYPPAWMAERVRERLSRGSSVPARPRDRVRRWGVPATIGAAAIVLVFMLPHPATAPFSKPATVTDDRSHQGAAPALAVFRRSARGTETLADGDVARPGDLLRLGYTSAGRAYGVIVSIDGRGAVTLHLPPNGARAASLGRDGQVLLDQAYQLDDAPSWERFYFITGDSAFEVAPILEAARRSAAGDLRSPPAALAHPRRAHAVHVLRAERGQTVKFTSLSSRIPARRFASHVCLALTLAAVPGAVSAEAAATVQRFTLVIGANSGGAERPAPAVRRLRRRALRPRVDRARRRRSGERNHPQATEAQRAPRRARSAERARGGSAPGLGGGRRPHGGAVLLLRARRRAGPAARRRPVLVPHAARSARSDSRRRAHRGARRVRVRAPSRG